MKRGRLEKSAWAVSCRILACVIVLIAFAPHGHGADLSDLWAKPCSVCLSSHNISACAHGAEASSFVPQAGTVCLLETATTPRRTGVQYMWTGRAPPSV